MITGMNGEIKQLKAKFGKGQKVLYDEIRELKVELTTQNKKVIVLEQSVCYLY